MNQRPLRVLLTTILVWLSLTGASGAIEVSQSLESTSIPYEDSVTFTITVSWAGPQSAYAFPRPLLPNFDRLQVRGFSSSISTTGTGDDITTSKIYRYTLIPTSSGIGRIDPVTIEYVATEASDSGRLVTDEMSVDIAKPVPKAEAQSFNPIVLLVVLLLFLLIVAVIIFIIVRQKRQHGRVVAHTPAKQALERLDSLKQDSGSDLKKFQTGLYPLLVDFAKEQFSADLSSANEEEVAAALTKVAGLTEDERKKLGGWVIRARRDKFSPVAGEPGEVLRLEVEVRSFLEKHDS